MNYLLFSGLMLLSSGAFSQTSDIEPSKTEAIIYRGFENTVAFNDIDVDQYEIETVNCNIQKSDENAYTVRTKSKEKYAKILFISNGSVVNSRDFSIKNLPQPSLYWGDEMSGMNTSNSNEIQVKYAPGTQLNFAFDVVGWNFSHQEITFSGDGNTLSQSVLEYIESIDSKETVFIEIKVKSEDQIIRKMVGSWIKG